MSVPVRAKICGLTRAEDAAAAAAAAADYLGVVFAGGPRIVDARTAREVADAAAGVPVFGVFGAQPAEEIVRLCRTAGLAGAQLHAEGRPDDAARLRAEGVLVWRVVRLSGAADLGLLRAAAEGADAVLIEPRVPGALGGTGTALPRELAREARAVLADATMVLAGGLTPESVGSAMALVRPDVVDVSSGVEILPGIKDPDKIARFLEAVVGHSALR